MFTKKPEPGESVTKLGERPSGESKSPFTERPATYAAKAPSPAASKMVPSIIGEDLTISGNVSSKGEIQVDGEIQGDIDCGSLLLGDKSQVTGNVVAEDVVVRGHVTGSIRGLRVTLQAQSHVEGDIFHQSLAIEQGAYFEGKSRRSDDPLAEVRGSAGGSARPDAKPAGVETRPTEQATTTFGSGSSPFSTRAAE
jgi:cytoskeletal protein CcmA (bactofilin family)